MEKIVLLIIAFVVFIISAIVFFRKKVDKVINFTVLALAIIFFSWSFVETFDTNNQKQQLTRLQKNVDNLSIQKEEKSESSEESIDNESNDVIRITSIETKKGDSGYNINPPTVYDLTISGIINSDQEIRGVAFKIVALNSDGEMLALARDNTNYSEASGSTSVYLKSPANGFFSYTWQGALWCKEASSAKIAQIRIDY